MSTPAPPNPPGATGPPGQPYGRDFSELLKRWGIRWTQAFRLNPVIQPVSVYDDASYVTKKLFPPSFITGSAVAATGATFFGIQMICRVDTIIRGYVGSGTLVVQVDPTNAFLQSLWTPVTTLAGQSVGQPGAVSQNLITTGSSTVEFGSSIFGGLIGTMQTMSRPEFFIPAGGVFQYSEQIANTTCTCGYWWDEPIGNRA